MAHSTYFSIINKLSDIDVKIKYEKILAIMDTSAEYSLNSDEKKAIEKSKTVNVLTREQVMAEAKQKYSNLKFK